MRQLYIHPGHGYATPPIAGASEELAALMLILACTGITGSRQRGTLGNRYKTVTLKLWRRNDHHLPLT